MRHLGAPKRIASVRVIATSDGFYGSGKRAWRSGHEYVIYKGPNGTKYLFENRKVNHNFKRGIGLLWTWDPGESIKGFFIKKG